MTVTLNLEDLLHYIIGCVFGVVFVLWIIKNIIPFGNAQASGNGGFLLFLLLLSIAIPIFQSTVSRKTQFTTPDKKRQRNKPDTDTILVSKRGIQEAVTPLENRPPPVDTFVNISPLQTLFFIQISSGEDEEAAHEFAKKYEYLTSFVVADNGKFIVVASDGFETKDAARMFLNLHKSDLPDGAFIVELITTN